MGIPLSSTLSVVQCWPTLMPGRSRSVLRVRELSASRPLIGRVSVSDWLIALTAPSEEREREFYGFCVDTDEPCLTSQSHCCHKYLNLPPGHRHVLSVCYLRSQINPSLLSPRCALSAFSCFRTFRALRNLLWR